MRICIYEDAGWEWLEPIALTRPAFTLWCGAERLYERLARQFAASEVGFWVRPALAELWALEESGHPVNDTDWLRAGPTTWINGRWLPALEEGIEPVPHVGRLNEETTCAVLPAGESPHGEIAEWLAGWLERLPVRSTQGNLVRYLWDIVDQNGAALRQDASWFRAAHGDRPVPENVAITGPEDQLIVARGATIEPFVFADTSKGPIMIDRDAVVHSFSRLEGPCYIGKESWILGAKLRAESTIGPCARVGGEIEASIVQGYTNKYHEGFLGHSYLGAWVNIAAATQTSDLRNDYDKVKVTINGQRLSTGRSKVGSYIGDHAKTGLGAMLNTGSTIGAFANVLPAGGLSPQVIPSFCQLVHGHLQETWDLRKTFSTAGKVMQRRGKTLTDAHRDFYDSLFESTARLRHQTIREAEIRQLRKSV